MHTFKTICLLIIFSLKLFIISGNPVADTTKTVADTTNSVADTTNPVADTSNPVADITNPVEDTTNTVGDTTNSDTTSLSSTTKCRSTGFWAGSSNINNNEHTEILSIRTD